MNQTGTTIDGRPVVSDVFPLFATRGVPLDIILSQLTAAGLVVSWPDYVAGALADGHRPARIKARVLEAVEDVLGAEYAREVGVRLDRVFERC